MKEAVIERQRIETRPCGCGRCTRTFTIIVGRVGTQRRYAEDCPVRIERAFEKKRQAALRDYQRRCASNPRFCHCGCGRALPRYVRFHPECETRVGTAPQAPREGVAQRPHRCRVCWDQPHRRDPDYGCLRCKRAYAPEQPKRPEVSMGCSLAFIPG